MADQDAGWSYKGPAQADAGWSYKGPATPSVLSQRGLELKDTKTPPGQEYQPKESQQRAAKTEGAAGRTPPPKESSTSLREFGIGMAKGAGHTVSQLAGVGETLSGARLVQKLLPK